MKHSFSSVLLSVNFLFFMHVFHDAIVISCLTSTRDAFNNTGENLWPFCESICMRLSCSKYSVVNFFLRCGFSGFYLDIFRKFLMASRRTMLVSLPFDVVLFAISFNFGKRPPALARM